MFFMLCVQILAHMSLDAVQCSETTDTGYLRQASISDVSVPPRLVSRATETAFAMTSTVRSYLPAPLCPVFFTVRRKFHFFANFSAAYTWPASVALMT